MISKHFRCTFLADIVLNSHTATEGSSISLDYIPGSNFLGIVAKQYNEFGEQAFEVFHSGKVRFGDAHPGLDNKRTFKVPAVWFYRKKDSWNKDNLLKRDAIFIRHEIEQKEEQLKQIRRGFFSTSGALADSEHYFAIKSGYDSSKRCSQDGIIYGYDALRKGSQWLFRVDADDDASMENIVKYLVGKRHIGRSRSSQYGRIRIEEIQAPDSIKSFSNNDFLIIYAESSLAFFDNNGQPTLRPKESDLKLPQDSKILWDKSQLRWRVYAPWNGVRKTRDNDRVCIDKGSVFIVSITNDFSLDKYRQNVESGLGFYRNEGFGQILLNPSFLQADEKGHPQIKISATVPKIDKLEIPGIVEKHESDQRTFSWIETKATREKNNEETLQEIENFIEKNKKFFSDITASQWGAVRSCAQANPNCDDISNELFAEPTGLLRHGKSLEEWNKNKCYEKLKKKFEEIKSRKNRNARHFLIKLSAEMAKRVAKKGR